MKPDQILDALGAVDESLLEESETAVTAGRIIPMIPRRWAGLAVCACAALLILGIYPLTAGRGSGSKSYYSADSTASYYEESAEVPYEEADEEIAAGSADYAADSEEALYDEVYELEESQALSESDSDINGSADTGICFSNITVANAEYRVLSEADAQQYDLSVLAGPDLVDHLGVYAGMVAQSENTDLIGAKVYLYTDMDAPAGTEDTLRILEYEGEYILYCKVQ